MSARVHDTGEMGGSDSAAGEGDVSLVWRVERRLPESHAVLWTVVVVASALDVVTTIAGLGLGVEEGNAVARAFLATYGTPGIGMLKLVALVVLVVTWAVLPDRLAERALAGFAVVSVVVVGLNTLTLAGL